MKRSLLSMLFALAATGCGPDVTAWKGTWGGSCDLNTGRQPMACTGTLVIADGARFTVTSDAQGSPAQAFSASLSAATVDATTATFTGPTTVALTATPAGSCTWQVTLDDGSATRTDDSLTATARGKVKTDCTGGSSTVENFLLNFYATRR